MKLSFLELSSSLLPLFDYRRVLSWALSLLILVGCLSPGATREDAGEGVCDFNAIMEDWHIDQCVENMTLEQKVGQIMVVGFRGTVPGSHILEMIEDYHIGGVILMRQNVRSPEQVAQLANDLQRTTQSSGHPGLIIAVDQEGGLVSRLKEYRGFTEFPGAMAITASGDPQNAYRIAYAIANELKSLGINANFAPVLDVNNNPANPVIGIRSFSSDSQVVVEYGTAFIEGLRSGGVIAVGKHFPGHGDTNTDSHFSLPVVTYERAHLDRIELVPFKAAVDAGIPGIMTGHLMYPALDAEGLPATLSRAVLNDLLREEMGYQGLIVTDSLEMGALFRSGYPTPLAAATALQAGADILLFSHFHNQHKAAFHTIVEWVKSGKIPEERLNEAVRRVLLVKAQYGIIMPEAVDIESVSARVGTQEHRALSREVAAQSVTLLCDDACLLPVDTDRQVFVVENPAGRGLGRMIGAPYVRIGYRFTPFEILSALDVIGQDYLVVVTTANVARYPAQKRIVNRLTKNGAAVIVVAMTSPYDLMAFSDMDTYLMVYGAIPPSKEALADVLLGRVQPQGSIPVELPGLFDIGAGLEEFER